ncbi:MAG: GAF domain-containing sensor histidine kinase [Cyanobacteria bacterium REEB459]|nr:GAF domain-containing sensor histidine kinase [Cyanobacteria bacterium REEB459]
MLSFSVPETWLDAPITGWPCCLIKNKGRVDQAQLRQAAIARLDLEGKTSIAIFEEAAQLAARFLQAPVSWVSVANHSTEFLKAASGLYSLGFANRLASDRQIPLNFGLTTYVLDSEQPVVIPDLSEFSGSDQPALMTNYGIRSYCGVPLITSDYECIGTLVVVDPNPRGFSDRDVAFLSMAARWAMAEYERSLVTLPLPGSTPSPRSVSGDSSIDALRLNLLNQLIQDLRNPLTAVLGMTSMLNREIYGPLTEKQREYTEIAWRSSQALMAQVDEILDLGLISSDSPGLVPASVDIERLGHQVITMLTPLAEKLTHTLELTVEPGQNLWLLDQQTVRQVLYHTLFSLIHMASANSTIRLHASRKQDSLALAVWVANAWTGDGLPTSLITLYECLQQHGNVTALSLEGEEMPRNWLGLVLTSHLVKCHGGELHLYGMEESGYRLGIRLPSLKPARSHLQGVRDPSSSGRS